MKQRYSLNFTEFLCVGHQPSWSGPPPPGEAETIRSLGVARTKKDKKVMIGDGCALFGALRSASLRSPGGVGPC